MKKTLYIPSVMKPWDSLEVVCPKTGDKIPISVSVPNSIGFQPLFETPEGAMLFAIANGGDGTFDEVESVLDEAPFPIKGGNG